MKKVLKSLSKSFALLLLLVFTACQDDEPANSQPQPKPLPYPSITLNETTDTDAGNVSRTEEFFFNTDQRLIRHLTTQHFVAVEEPTLQHETTLSYSDREVTVTDASGNQSLYTLGANGYATACTRTEGGGLLRQYTFQYSANTLTGITETIDNTVTASLHFETTGPLNTLLTVHNGTLTYIYHLLAAKPNTSRLPWLYLTELYPLNFHAEALYAKLLGEAPLHLLQSITPQGNLYDEQTTYTYIHNERGQLTSCTENLREGGVNYPRTITYTFK